MTDIAPITTALISVSDKTGIIDLARRLNAAGVRIISTGGTARLLADEGIDVTPVADVTGAAEMMDGRVKTLHPRVRASRLQFCGLLLYPCTSTGPWRVARGERKRRARGCNAGKWD